MSRRSRRHKKRFYCGHRGFGRYCHHCARRVVLRQAELALKQAHREQWQKTFAQDALDLKRLPRAIVLKAREVLGALEQGVGYWQIGGKRLRAERSAIKIPLTYRYRLLCRQEGEVIVPVKVMSHEAYNSLVRSRKRLLATLFSRGSSAG